LILLSIPVLLNLRLQTSKHHWTYNWQQTTSFQQARRALAATSFKNYIYVIGGINDHDEYAASVEYGVINPDGALTSWKGTSSLVEARFYHAAVSVKGYVYTLGGAKGARGSDNIPIASVERAQILADGSLGPWRPENYLTTPRRGTKAVIYGDHIYAIGGYNGRFLRSIERAEVYEDGSLSEWVLEDEQANIDRYIHSATIFNNNIYLLGGHVHNDDKVSYGDVEMSHILPNGVLSPWTIEKTMLQYPRFIASAFAMNNYLYILGGHDGANRLNSVEFAALTTEGHVGAWTATSDIPSGRDGAAVVTHGNNVYVLGGIDNNQVLNTVDMAQQAANGHLGFAR
jgi:hypothetical protein